MKTARVIPILLLAALAIVPLAPTPNACLQSTRAAMLQLSRLKGVVLDANNARITGASVRVESARFSLETESDGEGNFQLELPAGTYRLTVEKEGFKRFSLSPLRLSAGGQEVVSVHMKVMPPKSTLKIQSRK